MHFSVFFLTSEIEYSFLNSEINIKVYGFPFENFFGYISQGLKFSLLLIRSKYFLISVMKFALTHDLYAMYDFKNFNVFLVLLISKCTTF